MLKVSSLDVLYADSQVLWDVDLEVREGEIVALLGPNGAGKSTVLNSIAGLVKPARGSISFLGNAIEATPAHERAGNGLALVLERHRLFPLLTVQQNLLLGALRGEARTRRHETLRSVQRLFPILEERSNQRAQTLSGGEQQMVALARGLMSRPRLLMVDEPTLGLAPRVVASVVDVLRHINRQDGITILFVEQNVQLALDLASRGYILESGHVVAEGESPMLRTSGELKRVFLGMS